MGDISHPARGGGTPQTSGSGRAESRQDHDADEIRRFRAKLRFEVEQLKRELETRTRPIQEIAHERLARTPRRTESEMRGLLESELSRYPALRHGWDGDYAKPASPASLRDARKFLSMRPANVPLPYPELNSDGETGFFWDTGDLFAGVTFEGDGTFYFVVCRYSRGKETARDGAEDCPVDSGWPDALVAPLRGL